MVRNKRRKKKLPSKRSPLLKKKRKERRKKKRLLRLRLTNLWSEDWSHHQETRWLRLSGKGWSTSHPLCSLCQISRTQWFWSVMWISRRGLARSRKKLRQSQVQLTCIRSTRTTCLSVRLRAGWSLGILTQRNSNGLLMRIQGQHMESQQSCPWWTLLSW